LKKDPGHAKVTSKRLQAGKYKEAGLCSPHSANN
jgi:hypothetical protein